MAGDQDVMKMLMKLTKGHKDDRKTTAEAKDLLTGVRGGIDELKSKQTEYEDRLKQQETTIMTLQAKVRILESRVTHPEDTNDIRRNFKRFEEERRAKNVIIHGLTRGRMHRVKAAEQFFMNTLKIEPPFDDALWLGRPESAPLCVKLPNVRKRRHFRDTPRAPSETREIQGIPSTKPKERSPNFVDLGFLLMGNHAKRIKRIKIAEK